LNKIWAVHSKKIIIISAKKMDRSVQEGDLALVVDQTYIIRRITDEGMYISSEETPDKLSLLINDNNQWHVYMYNFPHTVTFQAAPSSGFLDIPEMNYEILKNLNGESLISACQTNRYLRNICDEYFWKQVVARDFGAEVAHWKPLHETYQRQYLILTRTPLKEDIILNMDRADLYQRYYQENIHPELLLSEMARDAAEADDRTFLEWLLSLPNERESAIGAADAALFLENLDLLKWLAERGIYPREDFVQDYIDDSEDVPDEILNWLHHI